MAGSGPGIVDVKASAEEGEATTNRAAYRHWLRAVHGLAEGSPALLLAFAGPGFASPEITAGLLLEADLRPDDGIFVEGDPPGWLDQAFLISRPAKTRAEASVLVTAEPIGPFPANLRLLIQTAGAPVPLPPPIRLTRPDDWTYESESIAD